MHKKTRVLFPHLEENICAYRWLSLLLLNLGEHSIKTRIDRPNLKWKTHISRKQKKRKEREREIHVSGNKLSIH
uniref:Uncharacterized protein n=1 Tax=Rhizophora mucronata TaxID=61149 RepID=A0A2P2JRR7_RHIMU